MGRTVAIADAVAAPAAEAAGACRHCGLPCGGADPFCCFGCEIAAEIGRDADAQHTHTRAALTFSVLLFMSLMMVSLFLYAEDVYELDASGGMGTVRDVFRIAAGVLATPVVVLLGLPLLRRALRAVASGALSMDLLLASGAFAAYGLSVYGLATGRSELYFDTACAALVLTTLGRYLEARARSTASAVIAPALRSAAEPVQVDDGAGGWRPIAPAQIRPGMRLRVDDEQVLPVDARAVDGPVEVNLAIVTGESRPVEVAAGDSVPAGAVPCSGALLCIAERAARQSTLARLGELVRSLRETRAPTQRIADRFAAVLVPAVWVLALGSLAYWASVDSIDRGVVVGLAVVLAACPCTYGVATPLAMWLALRTALRYGALVRDASALEQLAGVRKVVFDKTGTLTEAALAVQRIETTGGATERDALALARGLEGASRHPVARALVREAERREIAPADIRERRVQPGRGVAGVDRDGREVRIGAARAGASVELSRGAVVVARFWIDEQLRPEARAAVDALRDSGVDVAMATGDRRDRAQRIADALGIPSTSEQSAEDKARAVSGAGDVAMVGDGVNDAPAFVGAGPSFAVAEATGLARGVASVTLLRADLRLVPWTLAFAREVRRRVRANLAWATIYNVVFVALAAGGLLRPVWAAVAMITSSIFVVGRTLRIGAHAGPEEPG